MKCKLLIVLFLVLLSGCSNSIKLTEGKHLRTEASNRTYPEWKSSTEYADYYIEQGIVSNRDEAVELIKK
jgi:uncharacterized protein YceK